MVEADIIGDDDRLIAGTMGSWPTVGIVFPLPFRATGAAGVVRKDSSRKQVPPGPLPSPSITTTATMSITSNINAITFVKVNTVIKRSMCLENTFVSRIYISSSLVRNNAVSRAPHSLLTT